jgi:hypothetical protein
MERQRFSAHHYKTPTRPISPGLSAERKGEGDMSQEPEYNEASKALDTIKEHTRITPLAHANAAVALRGVFSLTHL